jgi:hypothetical protein
MRKSSTGSSPRTRQKTDDPDPVPATPPPEPESDALARLSVPLSPDGTVDASRLRERTKDALRKALLDPKLAESLGVTGAASSQDAKVMAQIANGLYDGVSALAIAMARRAGYSIQQASVLLFTADEKAMLAEPTVRVVNKHFPDFGGKYRDEIVLAFALTNIIAAKVMLLRAAGNTVTPAAPTVPLAQEPSSVA